MIDVTGVDKSAFAKAVYRLSVPKAMGLLHAEAGPLDDESAEFIANQPEFHMNYVKGRGCKMWLREEDGKLLAPDSWYDHTDRQYDELLAEFGFSRKTIAEHGCCCECDECRPDKPNRSRDWETANAAPNN